MNNVVWVDENDNILGEISIDKAHQERLLHRVSVVYLINDKGEILIQHRDDGRLDHSSAGHVDPGESYYQTAIRELAEELGVKNIAIEELAKGISYGKGPRGNQNIAHIYTIFVTQANPVEIDKHEVQSVFWANPKEILEDMRQDKTHRKYTEGFKMTILKILSYLKVKDKHNLK